MKTIPALNAALNANETSSAELTADCLAHINDPAGEGARTCLAAFDDSAMREAEVIRPRHQVNAERAACPQRSPAEGPSAAHKPNPTARAANPFAIGSSQQQPGHTRERTLTAAKQPIPQPRGRTHLCSPNVPKTKA